MITDDLYFKERTLGKYFTLQPVPVQSKSTMKKTARKYLSDAGTGEPGGPYPLP